MSVIAVVEIPAEEFTLGATLSHDPSLRVRLERVIPIGETLIPYFWVSDDSLEGIEAALAASPEIDSFEVLDELDGEALIRVTWAENVDGLVESISESGGEIIEAIGEGNVWRLQLRFDDHQNLTAFYRRCVDHDAHLDVKSIYNPGIPERHAVDSGITDIQRETLLTALEAGYFDVPRRINLVDLAARLDVSDTAVSQRLRRGISGLLVSTLADTGSDGASDASGTATGRDTDTDTGPDR